MKARLMGKANGSGWEFSVLVDVYGFDEHVRDEVVVRLPDGSVEVFQTNDLRTESFGPFNIETARAELRREAGESRQRRLMLQVLNGGLSKPKND